MLNRTYRLNRKLRVLRVESNYLIVVQRQLFLGIFFLIFQKVLPWSKILESPVWKTKRFCWNLKRSSRMKWLNSISWMTWLNSLWRQRAPSRSWITQKRWDGILQAGTMNPEGRLPISKAPRLSWNTQKYHLKFQFEDQWGHTICSNSSILKLTKLWVNIFL